MSAKTSPSCSEEESIRIVHGDEAILHLPPPPADARIPYGNEPNQFADLRVPAAKEKHPAVVVIHGGFWRALYGPEHIGRLCAAITARGFVTWSVEYRRLGNAGGGFPGTFLDVAHGVDHLRELAPRFDLDLTRVLVLGHSAGGQLALWAAARHRIPRASPIYTPDPLPVRAAISLAGVCDLRRASELSLSSGVTDELMGGKPNQVPERYAAASPIELVPIGRQQFLLHGVEDKIVPIEISERYCDAARSQQDDVTCIRFRHTGHFDLIDPESSVFPEVMRAIERAGGV